jgi:hypothetical protein
MPKETIEELLEETQHRVAALEANLPPQLDGYALSSETKLPFKAMWFRDALCWRMAQLSRSALDSFEKKKLASAILLTRASMETAAALWYLAEIVERVIKAKAIGEIDQRLIKLLLGTKTDTDLLPKAENVLNFVDCVDKTIAGFRHQYERLSEFAHPNWVGTALIFSRADKASGIAYFGELMRAENEAFYVGVGNLASALQIFQLSHTSLNEAKSEFIRLCEANVK